MTRVQPDEMDALALAELRRQYFTSAVDRTSLWLWRQGIPHTRRDAARLSWVKWMVISEHRWTEPREDSGVRAGEWDQCTCHCHNDFCVECKQPTGDRAA